MGAKKLPWMKFYTEEFLFDEDIRRCPYSHRGFYVQLMSYSHFKQTPGKIILSPLDISRYFKEGIDPLRGFAKFFSWAFKQSSASNFYGLKALLKVNLITIDDYCIEIPLLLAHELRSKELTKRFFKTTDEQELNKLIRTPDEGTTGEYISSSSSSSNSSSSSSERGCGGKPSLEDVRIYFDEEGFIVSAKEFFEQYEATGWTDASGEPIRNWKYLANKCNMVHKESSHGNSQSDGGLYEGQFKNQI